MYYNSENVCPLDMHEGPDGLFMGFQIELIKSPASLPDADRASSLVMRSTVFVSHSSGTGAWRTGGDAPGLGKTCGGVGGLWGAGPAEFNFEKSRRSSSLSP